MPELVRLYIRHSLIGFALAALFVALLVGFDIAGLRHLVLETDGGWLAGLVMVMLNGIVFAGVQFSIAIMSMAEDRQPPGGGLRQAIQRLWVPAPAPGQVAVPVRNDPQPRG
ncbi:hypothetical protein [Frigidibacter sp. ROC022]|uniref:hypothetical protein n=1 Tax=Frigidibacter sp. ROC022 TaxID=2971796 RepID=UPI00215A5594|nr:hypothetical protein [Frigidibacter sp. ROC022]MCR8725306.1 hypothetical protein [Frigidibacter sp. ROC022]